MKREYKIALILSVIGVVMIILGMGIWINDLHNSCKKLETQLKNEQVRNVKLQQENDALWDIYYLNISDYEGEYEYYE